jgi:hypothetical protein
MPSVAVKPLVHQKLQELFTALLLEDYFSLEENARTYVDKLLDFIEMIPAQKHRFTKNKQWGQYYAAYKANRNTTWYIVFDKFGDEGYIVNNVFNNHTEEYPQFIAGNK